MSLRHQAIVVLSAALVALCGTMSTVAAADTGDARGASGHSGVKNNPHHPSDPVSAAKSAAEQRILDEMRKAKQSGTRFQPLTAGSALWNLTYQTQATSYYCVPATSRAAISAWVSASSLPSQVILARREYTDSGGTSMSDAPPALNYYESGNHYVYNTTASSGGDVWARVDLNVSGYGAPLITSVRGKDLPQWAAAGWDGHHAILHWGTIDSSTLRMWDPVTAPGIGGRSPVSADTIYYAMNDSGNGYTLSDEMVW